MMALMLLGALVGMSFATTTTEARAAARERQKPYARAAGIIAVLLAAAMFF